MSSEVTWVAREELAYTDWWYRQSCNTTLSAVVSSHTHTPYEVFWANTPCRPHMSSLWKYQFHQPGIRWLHKINSAKRDIQMFCEWNIIYNKQTNSSIIPNDYNFTTFFNIRCLKVQQWPSMWECTGYLWLSVTYWFASLHSYCPYSQKFTYKKYRELIYREFIWKAKFWYSGE